MGTIAAIRMLVLRGAGIAVLPEYFVAADLAKNRLARVMPKVKLLSDSFRLVFRADDPRRSFYQRMASELLAHPLK